MSPRDLGRLGHTPKAISFLGMLCIPLLVPLGAVLGAWWLSPAAVFVGVPIADAVIGEDRTNISHREDRWPRYFWAIPHLYVCCWVAVLVWASMRLPTASLMQAVGLVLGSGIASAFATCAAHELLHRPGRLDQVSARLTMAICGYGHFVVEHLHHHATVGVEECGTVPRPGESLWRFVPRNIAFGFGNAYRVAERVRHAKRQRWFGNRVVQQHALTLVLLLVTSLALGRAGSVLFVSQALTAMVTVELVQYCEHYGLCRTAGAPITERLSWNSNGWLTNALTLNITRHSDHHCDARRPFQALRALPDAPSTPLGYFGLTWLALVPPLWRRAIEPIRAKYEADQETR
jgi:alkane 1-monooxygenase